MEGNEFPDAGVFEELADIFFTISKTRSPISSAGIDISALTLDEAYTIQQKVIDRRVARGERVVGYKVGCTSKAVRRQFGLVEPVVGRLMAPFVYAAATVLSWNHFVRCAVEPEFVFGIRHDVTVEIGGEEELLDAIEWVAPGIEVHNYKFWFGEPSSQELIAANGIHAALVVGRQRVSPRLFDSMRESIKLFRNDVLAASGIGADIMGGPLKSLRWLVRHLARRGQYLQAGQMVIPGSAVGLVSVQPNDRITAEFGHLGKIAVLFSE